MRKEPSARQATFSYLPKAGGRTSKEGLEQQEENPSQKAGINTYKYMKA
jgi:hypothetical protein